MNSCDEIEVAVEKRLHGALGGGEAAELGAHLAQCPNCRSFEAGAKRTEQHMTSIAEGVEQRIDWDLVAKHAQRGKSHHRSEAIGYLFLLAALCGAGVGIWRTGPSSGSALPVIAALALASALLLARSWRAWRGAPVGAGSDSLPAAREAIVLRLRDARVYQVVLVICGLDAARNSPTLAVVLLGAAVALQVLWVARMRRELKDLS